MNAKKVVKVVVWVLGVLIGVPILALLTLPLWLGPVVKPLANAAVPHYTKTAFKLGTLYANPYTCFFEIGDLTLANPDGFSAPNAFTLGSARIDVKTGSLFSDVLVIEEIAVEDLYVSSLSNDAGENNMDVILRNAQGAAAQDEAEAQKEAAKTEVKVEIPKTEKKAESAAAGQEAAEEPAKPRKIIIERLVVKGVRVQKGLVTIPAPGFELKDLGKDSGGYDPERMGQAILKEAWASIMASGADVMKLGADALKSTSDAMRKSTTATTETLKDATSATTDALKKSTDSLKGAADSLKGLFK